MEAGTNEVELQGFYARESTTMFFSARLLSWGVESVEVPDGMENVELEGK